MARITLEEFSDGQPLQTQARPKEDVSVGKTPFSNKVTNFLGLGKTTRVFGDLISRTQIGSAITGTDYEANREFVDAPTKGEVTGAIAQTAAIPVGALVTGGVSMAGRIAAGVGAGYLYDIGQDLVEGKEASEVATPGFGAIAGIAGPIGGKAVGAGGRVVANTVRGAGKAVTNSPVVKSALQGGIEFAERVPRFVSKTKANISDAATRAERIRTAPPVVGKALKSGLDERIINTIEAADASTLKGYKDIVRLAEESIEVGGTLKTTARPEIIAGDAAAKQFKLIDDQKKKIGQQIGEAVKQLPKDTPVSMQQSYAQLDDVLNDVGVVVSDGKLNFSNTGFTKAQRTKIKELYDLATEGGDALTPAQIHAKDRLFSQMQRESRMNEIGDIIVETGNGPVSLFRVFRDVYSETLESVAPQIKPLNRQYRNLSTFTEDIEKTLLKSGKYETNSLVDPAEYAQTNLRRLFSEAQSAADYRAIADEMDNAARALGYNEARPEDLARFAYEIRKVYPETTPRTGFEGSIKSIPEMVRAGFNAGAPKVEDQQKALRELLDYLATE